MNSGNVLDTIRDYDDKHLHSISFFKIDKLVQTYITLKIIRDLMNKTGSVQTKRNEIYNSLCIFLNKLKVDA